MEKPDDNQNKTNREIGNAGLFADDIVFSDTEKILFEEDLQENRTANRDGLMDGNPADRYSATKKLNQGGMKAIWEVDDHRTARKVAMALIQDSKIASEDDIDSFLYEARLTANLQHPNIIPIYDIALDENGNPYFTMKSLKGETLGEIIRQLSNNNQEYRLRYTNTRLLAVFLKVCNAIDYAHTKGVIHLDLKPSNVNIGDFGDVQVLDWGLSTLITHLNEYDGEPVSWQSMDDVSLENGQTLTRYLERTAKRREFKNVVGGTPGYMSPEQAQGVPSDIDFQTDVYMLGAMLYEILTYHCPLEGATVKEVLQKTVRGDFPPPGKCSPELRIPPALAAIAMKAMATDPADRYPNVAAMIRDIHSFQDGFATIAENPTFITHATLLVKRHKLAVSLIATTLAIIAVVLAQSFSSIKNSERVAIDALAELKQKNDYIEATAQKVAPDYLDLMMQQEKDYDFKEAEQSLDTGLAFDPSLETGWLKKGKMLLCQQKFSDAWNILSGSHGQPVQKDPAAILLAEKYKGEEPVPDAEIPQLIREFKTSNLGSGIPRLFYHLNRSPFDPETHFPAIAESLKLLNPKLENLNFEWAQGTGRGWKIDISGNPELDDISPLCGLDINSLNAAGIGTPDLKLLSGDGLRELNLADTQLNHLFELDQLSGLTALYISGTGIRNLSNIVRYPKLSSLDISGIEGLAISQQLIWCRSLKLLTVSNAFRNDPIIRTLARRGVIIIYSNN
ncbi:serine/threonine-protein kinase [Pontiella sulfatireligans]|uniref:Serine/threonine-protein kinase PknD n=1 Tax=Pontiella sulfatireligans TaxID=2750658 RepID=A0A6C2US79_9BACT|nr:serine/threonine-protein kinase [Pontiella sulfatireligans]VGO23118.1 Serine/threonine-protein kinase PknD [Pontiella sulfatireligans]